VKKKRENGKEKGKREKKRDKGARGEGCPPRKRFTTLPLFHSITQSFSVKIKK
jgi:hypothetical protein